MTIINRKGEYCAPNSLRKKNQAQITSQDMRSEPDYLVPHDLIIAEGDSISEKKPLSQLAMRFTGWLNIVVKRAKIDYIRSQKKYQTEISIEKLIDRDKLRYDFEFEESKTGFEFENDQIAYAFSKLTVARSQILIMLFVQNLTPQEIAEELQCSVQHVYNQRSLALKDLKSILSKEDK